MPMIRKVSLKIKLLIQPTIRLSLTFITQNDNNNNKTTGSPQKRGDFVYCNDKAKTWTDMIKFWKAYGFCKDRIR